MNQAAQEQMDFTGGWLAFGVFRYRSARIVPERESLN
jgi:hypothetical protein